jgi:ring-1,2-phenylacetyl-CoA epoxidase subunit PaaD
MSVALTEADIWQALETVKDPEIPVVSVVEMGIVRDVVMSGDRVTVKMTPTFSGCPALDVMRRDIAACVRQLGVADVHVETVLYPPWSTDSLSEETRARLKAFGLAPPPRQEGYIPLLLHKAVSCPYCDSADTVLKNSFGSTLCRAIYYCQSCQQPFEQFKAL